MRRLCGEGDPGSRTGERQNLSRAVGEERKESGARDSGAR